MKKVTALLLACALLLPSTWLLARAAGQTDYTIVDPYESVDWATYRTYLANLHTHTCASDGDPTLREMVNAYYDAGYDILALTDHGVINTGWRDERRTHGVFNGFRQVEPLSEEEYQRITTGADRDGRGMTDITGGIECNMAVVSKTHVNGYFTTWGSGVWGTENDYETAPREIEKAGGYSVLNHMGDWVNSNNYPERSHDEKYIAYFADIFTKYHTCLGMEIVNNTDNVTRADRALWDELLQVVIPTGRNIWAFADDDSEQLNEVGRSFELFPLAENTEENVKQAMAQGSFFAASRYDKTDRNNEFEGDGKVPLVTGSLDLFFGGERPLVTGITVDQAANTITVTADPDRDCETIEWIADGKVISADYTIDLNDFEDQLGCYVRFRLRGSGGVTYSQAFELRYEGREDKPVPARVFSDDLLGRAARFPYETLAYSLFALILEKLLGRLKVIPK